MDSPQDLFPGEEAAVLETEREGLRGRVSVQAANHSARPALLFSLFMQMMDVCVCVCEKLGLPP